jgi:Subtilase family
MRRQAWILVSVLSLLSCGEGPAFAEMMVRSPSINIQSRIPSMSVPRMDPSLAGRGMVGAMGNRLRIRPDCGPASGYCIDQPVVSADGHSSGKSRGRGNAGGGSVNTQAVANELIAEIDGTLSQLQADALARRHGLRRVESQSFSLLGSTLALFRLANRRTLEAARGELAADRSVRAVQPNFRYALQDQEAQLSEGDPAQYALAKLRLPLAHTLAHGANVTIAIVDSGVDLKHPEFAGAAITSFDAVAGKEGPHAHGTGVAGAIVSHARLMGSAPAARILAIRAFAGAGNRAESTSYTLLKALDYAAAQGSQIVNMSFAGPKDALVGRALGALAERGVVLVAAAGNAGAKSPPLYPGADANVIAVSATDMQDKLLAASNRGNYIALSAPGADIFLPAPNGQYQITSGTSFAAAYVSGVAALMLERNSTLRPAELRAILMKTARDLGPPGPDDQFGAGEADAFAAVTAVAAPAIASVPERPALPEVSAARTEGPPAPTPEAEKPRPGETQAEMPQGPARP